MLNYIEVTEAINTAGLRLVLSAGVPGPWGEAAKTIFDIKGLEYIPVAQKMGVPDPELKAWTGQESAPVAMFNDERPRTRWDEILFLAERLAPYPALIPADESDRAEMFGLSHCLCGEDGLAWNLRVYLYAEQAALAPDDPRKLPFTHEGIRLLRHRYDEGWRSGSEAIDRCRSILTLLGERLKSNQSKGSRYFLGKSISALDIYWATFSNFISPIEKQYCPMPEFYRALSSWNGEVIGEALSPDLIAHRDYILKKYFKLPMNF